MSSCFDGCRRAEDSRTGPQTRIKNDGSPGMLRCRPKFVFNIFCFCGLGRGRGAKIRMRFKGFFWRGKVNGELKTRFTLRFSVPFTSSVNGHCREH